ncbi:DUF2207 domain-containing protein [Inconstantimicrobium mannanitabidum]|uniref:Uncharacterized protein n=1 Tax=Inconstantimicrobium mannanitabidum TaxID=1604901 RepID=A0ACB5RFK7_9CLOT|nr:DUF2207 domain-containing protein [Clostridium sp. TW13]GKX67876.1 hypothetical protein rsdtw13_31340 [Clostridium sp. TW13]
MKKILSLFLTFFILITPLTVNASEKNFTISKLLINASIDSSGDLLVQEELTYNFSGNFNGVYINLYKRGTSSINVSKVSVKDKNGMIPLNLYNNEQNNTYELNDSNENTNIKIFSKSSNEEKTFIVNYTVKAAAVKYDGFGELYWSFYNVTNNKNVKDVELNVSLKDTQFIKDKFKYWLYVDGDFNTNYGPDRIQIKGTNLSSLLGVKINFQPEFLNLPTSTYTEPEDLRDYQNNINETSHDPNGNFGHFLFVVVGFVLFAAIFGFVMKKINNKKFRKELEQYRSTYKFFDEKILISPPSDMSPALVNLLYECNKTATTTSTKIKEIAIVSTLFYLSKKGFYSVEEVQIGKHKDLFFIRTTNKTPQLIHLTTLINWFSNYEENGKFSLRSVKDSISNYRNAETFRNKYVGFINDVRLDAHRLRFFVEIRNRQVLSNTGYDELLKWIAYKKYILHTSKNISSNFDDSYLGDAMIYGTALGIDNSILEKLSKDISNVYKKSNRYTSNPNSNGYYDYYNNDAFSSYYLTNLILFDSINDNVDKFYNTHNNSSSSFTGGDGGDGGGFGGFSDGGGFSGGGGSDSGAF